MDHVLPLEAIGPKLAELAGREVPELTPEEEMPDPTEMTLDELAQLERRGRPSAFVCPECQGTLFEFAEEGVMHYRCRVGAPASLRRSRSRRRWRRSIAAAGR